MNEDEIYYFSETEDVPDGLTEWTDYWERRNGMIETRYYPIK